METCNRHDLDAMRDFLAPDVRRAGAPRGADAWLDDVADLLVGFPDFRWKRIALVVEGDRLAVHLRTRGTHRGPWGGVAPTGRRISSAEFAFYRLEGERIVEAAGGADPSIAAQLTG
ncbi:ester cyclase [Amnibacterium endophyticum]|uniref:Ester cyclase n=1 Tax=Amnibacterium endophyticum TaxID=2109337 RepID=A0ABW4LFV1_9MICO